MFLNCRHATRLISQSLDSGLPWHRRVAVKIHLLYCVWCRRYAAQLRFLRKAAGSLRVEDLSGAEEKLSSAQKEQMRVRLESDLKNHPPSSR